MTLTHSSKVRRILLLHNRYKQRGGEDAVVAAESLLLRRRGHAVTSLIVDNDQIDSTTGQAINAVLASANPAAAGRVSDMIAGFRPDVVHVHNFFPRLSPSVHRAAARHGVAVVQTLHNYRLLCASATFFRDGATCEDCLGRVGLPAIRHACYRGSRAGSAAVVAMQTTARLRGIWRDDVDRFIALTTFAQRKFIEGGLPADRIVVKPNFLDIPRAPPHPRGGAIYVGRLSREKGLATLIDAWRALPQLPLTIVGTGPLEDELRAAAPPNVRFVGALDPEAIATVMAQSALMILPSLWYEGFPMVLVEAAAAGLPVLASRIGSLEEIVEPGISGALFAPGSAPDLAAAAAALLTQPGKLASMSESSRQRYVERYSPEVNAAAIEAIYEDAIARARSVRREPTWA